MRTSRSSKDVRLWQLSPHAQYNGAMMQHETTRAWVVGSSDFRLPCLEQDPWNTLDATSIVFLSLLRLLFSGLRTTYKTVLQVATSILIVQVYHEEGNSQNQLILLRCVEMTTAEECPVSMPSIDFSTRTILYALFADVRTPHGDA